MPVPVPAGVVLQGPRELLGDGAVAGELGQTARELGVFHLGQEHEGDAAGGDVVHGAARGGELRRCQR